VTVVGSPGQATGRTESLGPRLRRTRLTAAEGAEELGAGDGEVQLGGDLLGGGGGRLELRVALLDDAAGAGAVAALGEAQPLVRVRHELLVGGDRLLPGAHGQQRLLHV